jgi:outer membrane lipase/esterase
MPRTKLLASALALALGSATAAQAQSFSNVVVFGDSLSDAGNVAALLHLPAGNSFTTNPDPVYAQIVAAAFGVNLTNVSPYIAGTTGTDYAVGGACSRANAVGFTCVNDPSGAAGLFSLSNQVGGYLGAHGGHADPDALYMLWGGANDIFTYARQAGLGQISSAQAQQLTGLSALTTVGLAQTLQTAGARTIVVFNLPDLGLTPDNFGTANQAGASGLAFAFNSTFNGGLATLQDGIVPINTFGLINEIVANPGLYGFTNVTGRACTGPGAPSSVACGPAGSGLPYTYAAGTNASFLFADGVHPTGAAHAMLANVVIGTLAAPGQVSLAGELPLQVYDDQSNVINGQVFGMAGAQRDPGEANVYGQLLFGRQDFDASANTRAFEGDRVTGTFGADVRLNPSISVGAALSVDSSNGDGLGSSLDAKEILLSGYGVAHFGRGYVDAIVSGGSSQFDIDRSLVLGPTTRVEHGETSATHIAAQVGGGFKFGGEHLSHGPFVSLTWQKVDVDGYAEDGLSSTAMYFGDFSRKSQVTRIGYQLQGQAGAFRPFARVAWARDNEKSVSAVQAGSNTMNGHFTLDGFIPSESWTEADVGVSYAISERTSLSAGYRARLSDDTQDLKAFHIGFRTEFGTAQEVVPVAEEVVAPAATCADLDDDGDGVNNCDDKCPGSPAGEAVGADGCPVPAAAPEPAPEPKAYRN